MIQPGMVWLGNPVYLVICELTGDLTAELNQAPQPQPARRNWTSRLGQVRLEANTDLRWPMRAYARGHELADVSLK